MGVTKKIEKFEINLDEREVAALKEICVFQDRDPNQVLRSALRLYQMVDIRGKEGYEMEFINKEGKRYPTFSMLNLSINENPS